MTSVSEHAAENTIDIHATAGKLPDLRKRTDYVHPAARPPSRRSTPEAS